MSVLVVSLEHKATPLELLERAAVTGPETREVLGALLQRENLSEVVLLSTCLRTEVYAVADRFHAAVFEIHEFFAKRAVADADELEKHLCVRFDDDVADHLFAVAAGLESAVLGEFEVLGQVRRALETSSEMSCSGPVLGGLFRAAVKAGRRVRSETAISRGTRSFAHTAVALAADRLGGTLDSKTVTVLGAGEIGTGVLAALEARRGFGRPAKVGVWSRNPLRAAAVTGSFERVSSVGTGELGESVSGSDVVFCALALQRGQLGMGELALDENRTNPLLLVDLGMPRNVDPVVAELPGVSIIGIDDLREAVASASRTREAEVTDVLEVLKEELDHYRAQVRIRGAAPVVSALRELFESVRAAELERVRGSMSPQEWAGADAASRAALAKILHRPTMALKEAVGTPRGERLVEALRVLFDL
ncbi:MAG: glutamyl-tRNA reductase [Acidimicrobiales bacterium]